MKTFEYRVEVLSHGTNNKISGVEGMLNELGAEGWEVFQLEPETADLWAVAYLIRARPPARKSRKATP